ncbi:MAG: ABC transporter transmembrane domain-containing protein [Alphaproteobacteria bacterium]|nr:ABC transporter transmembrane domain-containing protein [Alphaproteobacteria bacterium]
MREKSDYDQALEADRPAKNASPYDSLKHLKILKSYIAPYKLQVFLASVSLVLAAAMILGIGVGLKHLIDQGFVTQNSDRLLMILLGLFGCVVLLSLSSFGRTYYVSWLGERIVANLRLDVFRHMLQLEVSFFEQVRVGELISRLTTDTSLIQILIGTSAAVAVRNILILAGGLSMMILISPLLTLYCLAVIPLVLIPISLLGRRVRVGSKIAQSSLAGMSGYIDEFRGYIFIGSSSKFDTILANMHRYDSGIYGHCPCLLDWGAWGDTRGYDGRKLVRVYILCHSCSRISRIIQ